MRVTQWLGGSGAASAWTSGEPESGAGMPGVPDPAAIADSGSALLLASVVTPAPVTAGYSVLQQTGSIANRIAIVFAGDGYTASQIDTVYQSHVASFMDYMFSTDALAQPFGRYKNFFNVYAAKVVSAQAGADKADGTTLVDTALNGTFYGDGVTERLLVVDNALAATAITQAMAGSGVLADISFVTVNSTKYGGSGGPQSVFAGGNIFANEVALHEIGHTFIDLADEYTAAGTGGEQGSQYTGPEPGEPNVTKDPGGLKWARWLGYEQPGVGTIGAYEGGRYYDKGIFRPSLSSKMRDLDTPFDAIAREQFILKFYQLVDPIDSATPGSSLTDPARLSVKVIDSSVIKTRWTIDGKVVSDNTLEDLNLALFNIASGSHTIGALAYDPTDWVRITDRSSLQQQVSWSVMLTHATLQARGAVPLAGGALSDTMLGDAAANTMAGGDGTDTLTGGLGDDRLTGGGGTDTAVFADRRDDVKVTFDGRYYTVTTPGEGTDLLEGIEFVTFADVRYSLADLAPPATFRLFGATGFTGGIGGYGTVFGTTGRQDVSIIDAPGRTVFDASFNRGGDVIRLAGASSSWSAELSGSHAILTDGDTQVEIPIGGIGTTIAFANGSLLLRNDTAAGVARLGTQALTSEFAAITAETGATPGFEDSAARGRLFLGDDVHVTATGNLDIFGRTGAQEVTLGKASAVFDGSFNRGGDTIQLDDSAPQFRASINGSLVFLDGGLTDLFIPVGSAGTTLSFGGDERILRYDAGLGQVLIGTQAIDATPTNLTLLG